MSQAGGQHGPRKDDALKRETRSEIQANRGVRTEEWREPEPPGEDQPDATWAPGDPAAGATNAIQLRSDLARYLDRFAFPADRDRLLGTLTAHAAPQQLLDLAGSLPGGVTFARLSEVLAALGLAPEAERS